MNKVLYCVSVFVLIINFCHRSNCVEELEWTFDSSQASAGKQVPGVSSDSSSSCNFEQKTYSDGERMAVGNGCIHCFCHRGKAKCFRQNCPPPPMGCQLLPTADSCQSSIYNCTIPTEHQKPLLRKDSKMYGSRQRGLGYVQADCLIRDIAYLVGETVGVASSTCLQCRCARHSLLCMPLCCYEPVTGTGRDQHRVGSLFHRAILQRDPHPLQHLSD